MWRGRRSTKLSYYRGYLGIKSSIYYVEIFCYKNISMMKFRTQQHSLDPGFSNHGSRPKIGSRRTLLWVSGTIMGRMGRRQICNIYIYIYNENIFDGVFFLEKKILWVEGRTWTPIIGSLQKSRENPGFRRLVVL